MSWYEAKVEKIAKMLEEKMSTSLVPPKYSELVKRSQLNNSFNTIYMRIIDLDTQEDYDNITSVLKKIEGVASVGDFEPKKLSITYNSNETSLAHIVYRVSKLGYRYINRF